MLGYEEVWRDENLDMLFAPAGYTRMGDGTRDLNGASSYQFLIDSVALNNKLYLHEIDHGTHLSYFPIDSGRLLDFNNGYPDAATTIEVLRRELATTLCKGGSLWWFDFMGNYYAAPEYEAEIAKQVKIADKITNMPRKSVADVAVFVDPLGYNLLKEGTNSTVDYVRFNLNALHKSGVAFESYNLSDITRLDLSRYKMLVFLYAPVISDEIKSIISSTPDKLKVFVHLPDVASSGKLDLDAPSKLTGISMQPHTDSGKVVYGDSAFGFRAPLSPLYRIADEQAEVIASYENGDSAVALKDGFAYIPVGNAPSELWNELAKRAGAHVYTDAKVPVYTDSRFICSQFPGDKKDVIHLKENGKYVEIFSGKKYKSKNKKLEFSHYNYQLLMFVREK